MDACRFVNVIISVVREKNGWRKAYHKSNFEMMKESVRRVSP
jgi:hypothetical protein